MWNKRKWHSILLVGLVLLLTSSVIACGQVYTKEDLQEAYQAGFEAGLAQSGAGIVPPPSIEPSSETETPTTPKAVLPAGVIWWYEAKDHIGDRTTVYGPVAGARYGATSSGKPTWLNIGEDYPSPGRFVVIIWGENRGNFPQAPEVYYLGKTIYVTGLVTEYNGIPQIEATIPGQIQEQ